ncbi:type IV toxin-antitoxin system AbiEi family antitoxin domain-containing protein [Oxalobacteraceae bacterium R-40]|uniref:Type IV toxin-antitoxin system AbiEi family antitoxin domain-containing protein n=1 Tax=Keguizhuia sedimenti TaxID=3064264 RepID=A0ABU1BRY4_9BURK|nr:type IV toxin-antitoxin system AbiEi family antitoxin domain-containing protein [Oxalobacteraceae bacterium R-40]
MDTAKRGEPMDCSILRGLDVTPKMAVLLAEEGWLINLSKETYLLRGDLPSRDGTLVYLSGRIPGLHVGGKTALDWQGVRHNVAFRERLVLWGQKRFKFPRWVDETISYSYQATSLFDERMDYFYGLKSLPNGNRSVLVSIPERAVLELVSEIGKGQSLEEVKNLMDFMRNLRQEVLCDFIANCKRKKVVKLVQKLGREAKFEWAEDLLEKAEQVKVNKSSSS